MIYFNSIKKRKDGGFTLVEIIVALGIFAVVAVVAVGALIRILNANKKSQSLQSAIDNLTGALESISREMRVGTTYVCTSADKPNSRLPSSSLQGCESDDGAQENLLAFYSSKLDPDLDEHPPLIFAYRFHEEGNGLRFQKAEQVNSTDSFNDSDFKDVISPFITITKYSFDVTGTGSGKNPYQLATIRIAGYAGLREKDRTYFDVQTSVSSRIHY